LSLAMVATLVKCGALGGAGCGQKGFWEIVNRAIRKFNRKE